MSGKQKWLKQHILYTQTKCDLLEGNLDGDGTIFLILIWRKIMNITKVELVGFSQNPICKSSNPTLGHNPEFGNICNSCSESVDKFHIVVWEFVHSGQLNYSVSKLDHLNENNSLISLKALLYHVVKQDILMPELSKKRKQNTTVLS